METTAFSMAEAHFKECQLVHEFLNKRIRPRVQNALNASNDTHAMFHGLLLRALGWFRSLYKLNEPADFQAVIVGSRALFEMVVDLTILHFDGKNHTVAKLNAWEQSAKLKAAESVKTFFDEKKQQPPDEVAAQMAFIKTDKQRIQALRARHWPPGKHPKTRWTGRDLGSDALAATKLLPKGDFNEWYAMRYHQACWNAHGSGLAGVRGVAEEHFAGISALGFRDCAKFALIAGEVVLREFGLWDAEVEREFEEHYNHRVITKFLAMQEKKTGKSA